MRGREDCEPESLKAEVRRFCRERVPASLRARVAANSALGRADYLSYYRSLSEQGLLVGHWPVAHGGRGWSPADRLVFESETAQGFAPWLVPMAVGHVGPVIYTYGTEEQKQRFLPGIRAADVWWSQGYSEPGAGSDLASLRMKAERQGDHYVVTGQKIWTSYAQWADWLYCLVRTSSDGRPQEGISFLLIDMKSPGVRVNPIVSMDMMHHLNEVFFDEVKVSVENLIGVEGQGWEIAKFLLNNERLLVAEPGRYRRQLQRIRTIAAEQGPELASHEREALAMRIAEFELRLFTLDALYEQLLGASEAQLTAQASMLKIRGSKLDQDLAEALFDMLGVAGIVFEPDRLLGEGRPSALGQADADGIIREHLYTRATTIFGGTTEIQYNILAKSMVPIR